MTVTGRAPPKSRLHLGESHDCRLPDWLQNTCLKQTRGVETETFPHGSLGISEDLRPELVLLAGSAFSSMSHRRSYETIEEPKGEKASLQIHYLFFLKNSKLLCLSVALREHCECGGSQEEVHTLREDRTRVSRPEHRAPPERLHLQPHCRESKYSKLPPPPPPSLPP